MDPFLPWHDTLQPRFVTDYMRRASLATFSPAECLPFDVKANVSNKNLNACVTCSYVVRIANRAIKS